MNNKKDIRKITKTYWNIGKITGILFTLWNYQLWTEPFNIVKAVLILFGMSVAIFVGINIIDMIIGLVKLLFSSIKRKRHEDRLLDGFIHNDIGGGE